MFSHIDIAKYWCQSIDRILTEHFHHLEGIYRILLDSSLDICLLTWHYIKEEVLPIEGKGKDLPLHS